MKVPGTISVLLVDIVARRLKSDVTLTFTTNSASIGKVRDVVAAIGWQHDRCLET